MTPETRIFFFQALQFWAAIYALVNKGGMTAAALIKDKPKELKS